MKECESILVKKIDKYYFFRQGKCFQNGKIAARTAKTANRIVWLAVDEIQAALHDED